MCNAVISDIEMSGHNKPDTVRTDPGATVLFRYHLIYPALDKSEIGVGWHLHEASPARFPSQGGLQSSLTYRAVEPAQS